MSEATGSDPSGPVWLDIEPFLCRLSPKLQPGELVHGEHFSLFDAMSAIEIGNPKMDPGSMPPTRRRPLDQSAPLRLPNDATLKVMDQLLAQEASWLGGNTLAQTVYTCLYLQHPERYRRSRSMKVLLRCVEPCLRRFTTFLGYDHWTSDLFRSNLHSSQSTKHHILATADRTSPKPDPDDCTTLGSRSAE